MIGRMGVEQQRMPRSGGSRIGCGSSRPAPRTASRGRGGIAGGLERDPVGLRLVRGARPRSGRASIAIWSTTTTSSASGTARGLVHAAPAARGDRDQPRRSAAPRGRTSRSASRGGRASGGRARARSRRAPRRSLNGALEQRVPEDHAAGRAEADRERRWARRVNSSHVLDPHRDVGHALLARERAGVGGEPVVPAAGAGPGSGRGRRR